MTEFKHMSQSITGPLVNWNDSDWIKALDWITRDDGTRYSSVSELRRQFVNLLLEGCHVVPLGKCDNFDKVKGCLGHEKEAP